MTNKNGFKRIYHSLCPSPQGENPSPQGDSPSDQGDSSSDQGENSSDLGENPSDQGDSPSPQGRYYPDYKSCHGGFNHRWARDAIARQWDCKSGRAGNNETKNIKRSSRTCSGTCWRSEMISPTI
jgi:hypothetical protein